MSHYVIDKSCSYVINYLMKASKGHSKVDAILEIGKRSGNAIKVDANGCCNVFFEGFGILSLRSIVP